MSFSYSDKAYHKAELDTYNKHLAMSFQQYLTEKNIRFHRETNGLNTRIIFFATDEMLANAQIAHDNMLPACLAAEKTLYERRELLSKYFNYVETLDNCELMLHMKATPDDTTSGDILTIRVNPGGDGIIKWDQILSMISWERKRIGNLPQYLREIYLMDKTYDDVLELANQINKRLDDCLEAVSAKITSESFA